MLIDFPMGNLEAATALEILPDQKILIAGWTESVSDANGFVMRLKSDGAFDTAFSPPTGIWNADLGYGKEYLHALALQPDHMIIVTGYPYVSDVASDFATACLNKNGGLNSVFGTSGKVLTDVAVDYGHGVAIDALNRVLVVGDDGMQFLLVRYAGIVGANEATVADNAFRIAPNPVFDNAVSISYDLPVGGEVTMELWNTEGRLAAILLNGWREAGHQEEQVMLPEGLPNGIYYCRVRLGESCVSGTMMLAR